jgi:hypothetical protein
VVAHEVRLLADGADNFFDALGQAVGRYSNCIAQGAFLAAVRVERPSPLSDYAPPNDCVPQEARFGSTAMRKAA